MLEEQLGDPRSARARSPDHLAADFGTTISMGDEVMEERRSAIGWTHASERFVTWLEAIPVVA